MAYFKVAGSLSGKGPDTGAVIVLYSFFLDPGDSRYDERFLYLPVFPKDEKPPGVEKGVVVDKIAFQAWVDTLPGEWKNTDFHNHFVAFKPDVTDEEIMFVGDLALQEAYALWEKGKPPYLYNQPISFDGSSGKEAESLARAEQINSKTFERKK